MLTRTLVRGLLACLSLAALVSPVATAWSTVEDKTPDAEFEVQGAWVGVLDKDCIVYAGSWNDDTNQGTIWTCAISGGSCKGAWTRMSGSSYYCVGIHGPEYHYCTGVTAVGPGGGCNGIPDYEYSAWLWWELDRR